MGHALAQTLVCDNILHHIDACGACAACRKVAGGNHPDMHILQPNEKGSIPVQAVRTLAERLALRASEAAIKVAIIEHGECMAPAAQNALLKTLEEPPGDTCFVILAQGTLLSTIRSRCQHLRLQAPSRPVAEAALVAGGIAAPLAQLLAPWTGADVAQAQACVEQGAAAIDAALTQALEPDATPQTLFRVAADLGGDRERCELALHLFEVRLHDAMVARRRGPGQPHPAHLAQAAGEVQRLRRTQALHLNRAMALEGLFLRWAGKAGEAGP